MKKTFKLLSVYAMVICINIGILNQAAFSENAAPLMPIGKVNNSAGQDLVKQRYRHRGGAWILATFAIGYGVQSLIGHHKKSKENPEEAN